MAHWHHLPLLKIVIVLSMVLILFIGSQIFWLWKLRSWKQRLCHTRAARIGLDIAGLLFYAVFVRYGLFGARQWTSPTRMTFRAALLSGPWAWWFFGSLIGFLLYLLVRSFGLIVSVGAWPFRSLRRRRVAAKSAPRMESDRPSPALSAPSAVVSPGRRRFFHQAATLVGAVPFAAGAYGILYGRLNLTTTHPRIVLPRLPAAFEGFRILQLSDLHIGPFMTANEIRKIVEIANRSRPDLVALTGDFVTWDPSTQYAVVDALSGLKAPHGVIGCLGNHEIYTHTQASMTRLFASRGIRILRQESAIIFEGRDFINLIGVDYQSRNAFGHYRVGFVREYLEGVDALTIPGTVNILMSHNPNTFDRAAALGIDLSLAGHTHGGQVSLEFVHIDISPSRLITPYVEGWFQKGRGQLYVNRGIGTIGIPMRLGAPPEITIYNLTRNA